MLIRAIAVALAASPALAGDLSPAAATPAPAPPAAAPSPTGEWGGGFVGAQLSYGDADADGDRSTGGFYGLHAGYRYDFGRLVLGGEVGYDRTDVTFPNGTDADNILRAGLTLGFDLGRFLPHVTAGYAAASLTNDANDFEDTYDGGFLGLGLAYEVSDRVIIGGEAVRHRFDADGTDADLLTVGGRVAFRF